MYPFKAERARKPANYQTHNRRYKKLVNGGRGQTLTLYCISDVAQLVPSVDFAGWVAETRKGSNM